MKKTISEMIKEIYDISKGFSKGTVGIILPLPKGEKPKWCQCNKCKQWHYMAK